MFSSSVRPAMADPFVVRVPVALHRSDCACYQCAPGINPVNTVAGETMVVWLGPDEEPPPGWRRVPASTL